MFQNPIVVIVIMIEIVHVRPVTDIISLAQSMIQHCKNFAVGLEVHQGLIEPPKAARGHATSM